MTIYLKILFVVLPLVFLNFFAAVATTYYFSRSALTDLAGTLLETRLSEAMTIASDQMKILQHYGLENIPASIAKAKIDAGTAISHIDVGNLGYVFAINAKGVITIHPEKKMVGQDVSHSAFYRNLVRGTGHLIYPEKGEKYLARSAPFTPWGWTIIATDPLREVFQGIDTMKPYILYLWIMGTLVTAIIIMGLLRQLTKPLRHLSMGVDKIGKGDLTAQIPVHSHDEFGKLSQTFNKMASQLSLSHQELERRVLERTAELNRTNRELHKNIEEKKSAVNALQYSEQRMKAILEASPIGIGLVIDRKIHWVNETICKMIGYKDFEILGKKTSIFYKDREEYERVGKFLYAKMAQSMIGQVETEWTRKDGTLMNCNIRAYPLDPSDTSLGVIIAATDITEAKLLESELQQARKMEAIGTLAGGVAHDLNNILSGIVSYPELLLLELPENSPLQKPLKTIKNSGERAATIVQDLLTMARRGVSVTEIININTIIDEQLTGPEFQRLLSFHPDSNVIVKLDDNLKCIKGSPAHLAKSIMNLITNAAEAMPDGGDILIATETITFETAWRGYETIERGEYAAVTISDGGIGISKEDMERIFEPFYTKKKMGRSGTGLGMAVVWGTIKDHDGYIDVQSSINKGATFTLYLPTTQESPAEAAPHFSLDKYKGAGEKILVVDDSPVQREIAESILLKLGYQVVTVPSGEEAVEYVRTNRVDLLILDMIMPPGMDGLDTYREIFLIKPEQKIIVASGFSETERVKEILRMSNGRYLKKPYSLEGIGVSLKEVLST